jgi:hypothetical protein
VLPAAFKGPISIFRNWTYAVFYTMAELWGSVVVSLLFWGFANEVRGRNGHRPCGTLAREKGMGCVRHHIEDLSQHAKTTSIALPLTRCPEISIEVTNLDPADMSGLVR